jgi:NAD(P)H-nitrite reductase large subunit
VLASPEMDLIDPLHPAVRSLKTICRCNNINYRTIERAIREGARTVSQIAVRTTATTGYCGGNCTPEILAMLTYDEES